MLAVPVAGLVLCEAAMAYSDSHFSKSMLDAYPSLQAMYKADDGNTEVFYFKNATATFASFTKAPETITF